MAALEASLPDIKADLFFYSLRINLSATIWF